MKLFIFTLILPHVLGCPDVEDVVCQAQSLKCGGELDQDGCPTPQTCLSVDPYARCSESAYCPVTCPADSKPCPGEKDRGTDCDTQGHCIPSRIMGDKLKNCDNHCPAICGSNQKKCSGAIDTDGCPRQELCRPIESCCPDEMECSGGVGDPSHCMKLKNGDCDNHCPAICVDGETKCNGISDINGCIEKETCQRTEEMDCADNEIYCQGCEVVNGCHAQEPTAICKDACPLKCPTREWLCPMGLDDRGCLLLMPCSINGECPEEANGK